MASPYSSESKLLDAITSFGTKKSEIVILPRKKMKRTAITEDGEEVDNARTSLETHALMDPSVTDVVHDDGDDVCVLDEVDIGMGTEDECAKHGYKLDGIIVRAYEGGERPRTVPSDLWPMLTKKQKSSCMRLCTAKDGSLIQAQKDC